ncbi:MAG TPA: DUF2147 domain-containing protein [Flavobacteriales bacterium]|nr:DUF2147 domain-containing protein [Flavobacteriales bacterium]
MKFATLLTAFLLATATFGQDIAGRWITVDDNTGKQRSVVEITVAQGVATGRIVHIFDKSKQDKTCTACTGDRKDQRVLGMEIIRGMKPGGNEWKGGTILDPDNGKVYDCKMWTEGGKLKVRGYIAFFFRTQTWLPEGR